MGYRENIAIPSSLRSGSLSVYSMAGWYTYWYSGRNFDRLWTCGCVVKPLWRAVLEISWWNTSSRTSWNPMMSASSELMNCAHRYTTNKAYYNIGKYYVAYPHQYNYIVKYSESEFLALWHKPCPVGKFSQRNSPAYQKDYWHSKYYM